MNLWLNWSPTNNVQIGGGFRHVDSRYVNDGNTEKMPEYAVFDASVNWMARMFPINGYSATREPTLLVLRPNTLRNQSGFSE